MQKYKKNYTINGRSRRTKFNLAERLRELPVEVYEKLHGLITDKSDTFGNTRKRWSMLIKDETSDFFLYEASIFCEVIGCTPGQLMNADVSLYPIYNRKKIEDEKKRALSEFGLTNE